MDPIASFSGLASGIQWRDMIDQIMKLESSRRLKPVTDQVSLQEKRRTAWDSFNSLVSKLRDSATSFKDGSAFGLFGTSVSESATGRKLVSASASDTAAPGTYKVEVLELAKAEKLGGSSLSSATDALGLSGSFSVNGQSVTLGAADSLSAVRDKVNAVSGASGVTATILSTSSTSHRLVLTANDTGASGIQLTDGADGLLGSETAGGLQGLGLLSNASAAASSTQKSLELALGVSPPPAKTTVLVGGVKVEVDFANDTLLTLQDKFSQAGATASIKQETVNGRAMYRLVSDKAVTADSAPTAGTATDSQNVVNALAFATSDVGAQISAGADAKFKIDGYTLTRSSNKVTDAIEGVTLDLLASDATARNASVTGTGLTLEYAPKSISAGSYDISLKDDGAGNITAAIGGKAAVWDAATKTIRGAANSEFEGLELSYSGTATSGSLGTLTVEGEIAVDVAVTRDLEGTKKKVQEFVDAYNGVANFLKRQRDTKGPLSTDGSLRSMVGSLREVMFKDVQGLSATNTYTRLSLAGVEFTDQGTLQLKSTTLEKALSTNQYDVKELFAGFGTMMESSADAIADEYEGSVKLHTEALSVSIASLKDRRENIEAQMERRRRTMTKQFTAMELAMTQLQSQSGSLSSQLLSMQPRS